VASPTSGAGIYQEVVATMLVPGGQTPPGTLADRERDFLA